MVRVERRGGRGDEDIGGGVRVIRLIRFQAEMIRKYPVDHQVQDSQYHQRPRPNQVTLRDLSCMLPEGGGSWRCGGVGDGAGDEGVGFVFLG